MTKTNDYRKIVELSTKVKDLKTACIRRGWESEYYAYESLKKKRTSSKTPDFTVKEFADQLIKKRLTKIAVCLPSDGYSMGGERTVAFATKRLRGTHDSRDTYGSARWRGSEKHGYVQLNIMTAHELSSIKIIGGIITKFISKVQGGAWQVETIKDFGSKQHHNVFWRKGYIYKDYHFLALDELSYVKDIVKAREKEQKVAEKLKRFEEKYRKLALKKFYGIKHSLEAGNCLEGTRNFAKCAGLNIETIGGIRGDFMLQVAEKCNVLSFAERIIFNNIRQMALK